MFQRDVLLNKLESELTEPASVTAMLGDKWLMASCLQKSVRFGNVKNALPAATSLWQQDRQSFWRRLHVIALEDIGIGSPDTVIAVLIATASSTWRRRVGDLAVGLHLIRMMCGAVKSRAADELYLQIERASCHAPLREHLAASSDEVLVGYVADTEKSLIARATACWLLAGTGRYSSELMPPRKGSDAKVMEVLRSLPVPTDLTESCIAVMAKTQWPLCIFQPLIWQETRKQTTFIRLNTIPPSPEVEGIPHYAADMFTRIGKACFRQLQKAVSSLNRFTPQQIGLGVFYLEGGLLDKALVSHFLCELQQTGESADMENAGLDPSGHARLRECLNDTTGLLAEIRQHQLTRYVAALPTTPAGGLI